MMRTICIFTCLLTALLGATPLRAEIVLVAHAESTLESMTPEEITALYMGRKRLLNNGELVVTYDLDNDSQIRDQFYQALVGKSAAQINAYWARLHFTGKAQPPIEVLNADHLKTEILAQTNAIAYIDETALTPNLKVIYRFENPK